MEKELLSAIRQKADELGSLQAVAKEAGVSYWPLWKALNRGTSLKIDTIEKLITAYPEWGRFFIREVA